MSVVSTEAFGWTHLARRRLERDRFNDVQLCTPDLLIAAITALRSREQG